MVNINGTMMDGIRMLNRQYIKTGKYLAIYIYFHTILCTLREEFSVTDLQFYNFLTEKSFRNLVELNQKIRLYLLFSG